MRGWILLQAGVFLLSAFDVTPGSLIAAIITEWGVFKPGELVAKFSSLGGS